MEPRAELRSSRREDQESVSEASNRCRTSKNSVLQKAKLGMCTNLSVAPWSEPVINLCIINTRMRMVKKNLKKKMKKLAMAEPKAVLTKSRIAYHVMVYCSGKPKLMRRSNHQRAPKVLE